VEALPSRLPALLLVRRLVVSFVLRDSVYRKFVCTNVLFVQQLGRADRPLLDSHPLEKLNFVELKISGDGSLQTQCVAFAVGELIRQRSCCTAEIVADLS